VLGLSVEGAGAIHGIGAGVGWGAGATPGVDIYSGRLTDP